MLEKIVDEARRTMNKNMGGPFGATITDKEGNIISIASNTVLSDFDPTAHAEMNAIRKAGKKLKTHNLKDYILYTTAYPCPMCLSAIIWANIKEVYYGMDVKDTAKIGFRDDFIYKYLKSDQKDENILKLKQIEKEKCEILFKEYVDNNKQLY